MTIAVFLATLGAALRLTRLGVEDTITQPFRTWLVRRWTKSVDAAPEKPNRIWMWLTQLFECPWCLGFWVSAGLTVPAVISDGAGWYLWPATALSISYLIGVASTIVATIEEIN